MDLMIRNTRTYLLPVAQDKIIISLCGQTLTALPTGFIYCNFYAPVLRPDKL